MRHDDDPDESAFRARVRDWLQEHARTHRASWTRAGEVFTDAHSEAEAEHIGVAKAWQRELHGGGWAAITWPVEHGGAGGTRVQQAILDQEQATISAPRGVFSVGIGMVGPTLIAHGTDEQRARYLGPMLRGDEIWCQLFSEPGAGSDLASLSTRADRDGDQFVVNGQKVWSSGAHYSDFGILLARTNPDAPKHRGISCFALDMRAPGVDVRPLRQMTGAAHFNEVFLTDVRIPACALIGELDDGWRTAMTTLMNERSLTGVGSASRMFADVLELARRFGRTGEPATRQRLAELHCRLQIAEYLGLRARASARRGDRPGVESSILKLVMSLNTALVANLAVELEGACGLLAGEDATVARWHSYLLGHWGARIGGGTDQIQRNIIGERVLALPREPRTDR